MAGNKDREERLAAALRDNLRKRKARARETNPPLQGEWDQPQADGGVSGPEDNPRR